MASTAKPKLLVLTTTYPRWADDTEPPFVHELARRLDDSEVHVIAPHAPGAATREVLNGVHVHRFRYAPEKFETLAFNGGIAANLKRSRWKYLLLQGFLLSMFFLAIKIAREHDIHRIHAHWLIPTGLVGATIKELLPGNNQLLLTGHGGDINGLSGGLFQKLRRWVVGEADAVSVVSAALRKTATDENWPQTPAIASMGVDLQNQFAPGPPREPGSNLIYAGRLSPTKGLPHLLEAMVHVVAARPEARLQIAGHGVLDEVLKARVESLGLEEYIRFSGRYTLEELPLLFQQADIAVMPFDRDGSGNTDGLGLTTLEAMGCELPVIAGDIPAVREIIEHQQTGILVNSADHQAFAEAILDLLNAPGKGKAIGQAARLKALAHYDWSIVAKRYRDLLSFSDSNSAA